MVIGIIGGEFLFIHYYILRPRTVLPGQHSDAITDLHRSRIVVRMPCCQIQTGEQHLILSGVTVHLQVQQHTDRVRACVCGQYAGMRHQAVIGISGACVIRTDAL